MASLGLRADLKIELVMRHSQSYEWLGYLWELTSLEFPLNEHPRTCGSSPVLERIDCWQRQGG